MAAFKIICKLFKPMFMQLDRKFSWLSVYNTVESILPYGPVVFIGSF